MTTIFKSLPLKSVELKLAQGEARKFGGYASTFGNVDSYGDTIVKGAYIKTLAENGMPKMFFGHKWDLPIGKWVSAVEDEKGLYVEGELTEGNPQADAVLAALKHGTVDGLSIGFRLSENDFEMKKDGGRLIKSISNLYEISIVNFPADGSARISEVRSEDVDGLQTIRELETCLRDSGFSKNAAMTFMAKAKQLFSAQRDSEADEKSAQEIIDRLKRIESSL